VTHPNRKRIIAALKVVVASAFPPPPDSKELAKYRQANLDVSPHDEYGLDAGFSTEEEGYEAFVKDVNEWYNKAKALPDPFTIYRNICKISLDDLNTEQLGVHWSYIKFNECSDSKDQFYLETEVKKSEVDWYRSIARNLDYPDEHEINIKHKIKKVVKVYDKHWTYLTTIEGYLGG